MTERPGTPAHITIPLFPLPDVVLFPGVVLPLHIFEPRYRRLVEDVLAGDRRLGMAVLKPGWGADYEGSPDIYATAGFGVIEAASRLEDGRLLIRLRGEGKGPVGPEIKLELLDLDDPEERARRVTVLLEIAIAQRRAIERSRPHGGVEAELN